MIKTVFLLLILLSIIFALVLLADICVTVRSLRNTVRMRSVVTFSPEDIARLRAQRLIMNFLESKPELSSDVGKAELIELLVEFAWWERELESAQDKLLSNRAQDVIAGGEVVAALADPSARPLLKMVEKRWSNEPKVLGSLLLAEKFLERDFSLKSETVGT